MVIFDEIRVFGIKRTVMEEKKFENKNEKV